MSELKSMDNMSCLRMIGTQNGSAIRFINRTKKDHENEVFFTCGQFTGMVCKSAQDYCKKLRADWESGNMSTDQLRRGLANLNFCQLSIDGSEWIPAIDIVHNQVKAMVL